MSVLIFSANTANDIKARLSNFNHFVNRAYFQDLNSLSLNKKALGSFITVTSASFSRNQLLQALAREKHYLLINILEATEQVALQHAVVGNNEALGDTIKIDEFNDLLKTIDYFLVIMTYVEFNQVLSRINVLLVDI